MANLHPRGSLGEHQTRSRRAISVLRACSGLAAAIMALSIAACSSAPPAELLADPWKSSVVMAPDLSEHEQRSSLLAVPPRLTQSIQKTIVAAAPLPQSLPKGGGYRKIGKPYLIKGIRYEPQHDPDYVERGVASWYGDDFHGKKTANGEVYDMHALTAAHRTLPLPSFAYVTNLKNGRKVMVRLNDRGPFKKGRIIDVSSRVAKELGFAHHGTTEVEVRYIGPAPLDGSDHREKAYLAEVKKSVGASQKR